MKTPPNRNLKTNSAIGTEAVAALIRKALDGGASVEINGLGVFRREQGGRYQFISKALPRVFIAYAREDSEAAENLYERLEVCGFNPWLDRRKLLPGQNWPKSIENAIQTSDFAIACFSRISVKKKGSFQAELRYSLDCGRQLPLDDFFLVPVRLDDCRLPASIERELHYIDMFPDWERGCQSVAGMLRKQIQHRKAA